MNFVRIINEIQWQKYLFSLFKQSIESARIHRRKSKNKKQNDNVCAQTIQNRIQSIN